MDRPALPDEPDIKIEHAGGVRECCNDLPLNGNPVRVDFTIECLAYGDGVLMPAGRGKSAFGRVEPEVHAIEEMEAGPINDWSRVRLFFGSEENRGAEEPLEAFAEAAVVRAVFGKMEEVEHLGGRIEMELAGFLPQGESGHPDGEKAVLAEREPEVGMGDDMEKKSAIVPAMHELCGGWATKR